MISPLLSNVSSGSPGRRRFAFESSDSRAALVENRCRFLGLRPTHEARCSPLACAPCTPRRLGASTPGLHQFSRGDPTDPLSRASTRPPPRSFPEQLAVRLSRAPELVVAHPKTGRPARRCGPLTSAPAPANDHWGFPPTIRRPEGACDGSSPRRTRTRRSPSTWGYPRAPPGLARRSASHKAHALRESASRSAETDAVFR